MISPTVTELNTATLEPLVLAPLRDRPLVSILVANYNYANYISQTLESALAQSYDHFELIVCDDGSTDDSVRVIEEYVKKDGRIRLLRKQNGGHGSALNAAYAASRGSLICLLDSDDLFLPDKVQQTVDAALSHPESGFFVHRVIRMNAEGRRQGVWPLSAQLPAGWIGPETLRLGGVVAYLPPTSGLSLRREIAERLFPLPAQRPLGICPDQVIMRLAPLLSPITTLDQPLAEYRLHDTNSYGTPRITAAFLEREISICQNLWQCQWKFLEKTSPALAEQLTSVEGSPYLLYLNYLLARLRRDPLERTRHREYMANLRMQPHPRYVRFWQYSIHLPVFLFDYAINLMSRQSAVKQVLARLKGLV
jgi:glycosyltransferase involved in cell wall biosynthesis